MRSMRKTGLWLIAVLSMVLTLSLTACNRDDTPGPGVADGPGATPAPAPVVVPPPPAPPAAGEQPIDAVNALAGLEDLQAQFPDRSRDDRPTLPRDGTLTLRRASMGEDGFSGLVHPHLTSDAVDSWTFEPLFTSLVASNEMRQFIYNSPYAPIIMTWDTPTRTVTLRMRDGLQIFWSDGVELTLADVKYSYYFISHPQYQGIRFTGANGTTNVVGARAFNAGEVDYIAGINLSADNRTMTITYIEGGFPPSALFGGILNLPTPRHHFEGNTSWGGDVPFIGGGIPIGETMEHPNARENMIGWGPYIIESIVPGESVLKRANDNYWRGTPAVDFILSQIVPPALNSEMFRAGEFDIGAMRIVDFPDYGQDNNITLLGAIAGSQNFFYFTLGAQRHEPLPLSPPVFLTDDAGNYVYVPIADQIWNRVARTAVDEDGNPVQPVRSWVLDEEYFPILIYRDENGNTIEGAPGMVRAQESSSSNLIFFVPRTDNHPITDVRFRRAVGYAMDFDTLNFTIHNGFRRSATSILHPFNTRPWIDPYQFGTAGFHPDTANALLDQVWADRGWPAWTPGGTGLAAYRQVPNAAGTGYDMFTLNFAFRPSGQLHHIMFPHFQSNLREVGIHLNVYQGDGVSGFIAHATLVDRNIVGAQAFRLSPNDSMHMWNMSWSMGWNPNPRNLWADNENFNLSRFASQEFMDIFYAVESVESWDADFLAEQYRRWNLAFETYYPAVYDFWNVSLTKLNNRVTGWSVLPGAFIPGDSAWYRVGVNSHMPYVHTW